MAVAATEVRRLVMLSFQELGTSCELANCFSVHRGGTAPDGQHKRSLRIPSGRAEAFPGERLTAEGIGRRGSRKP